MSIDSIHSKDFLWLFTWLVGLLVESLAVARACACGLAFFPLPLPGWFLFLHCWFIYLLLSLLHLLRSIDRLDLS